MNKTAKVTNHIRNTAGLLTIAAIIVLSLVAYAPQAFAAAQITLGWDASSDENVVGYNVYYGLSSGLYDIFEDAGDATEYTIAGLENGQTYYLAVTSYDAEGNESEYSVEIPFTTPEADEDRDNDGLLSADELVLYGTDPDVRDTDGDGIPDGEERIYWGDQWDADLDDDGLINLLDADSDGDGDADGYELDKGTNPGYATPEAMPEQEVEETGSTPLQNTIFGKLISTKKAAAAKTISNVKKNNTKVKIGWLSNLFLK
jgi:hypothetical protein